MNYPTLDGCGSGLSPIVDPELVQDVLNVILNRVFGNAQSIANLLVAFTFDDQRQHFHLAGAQVGRQGTGGQNGTYGGRQVGFAAMNSADGADQLIVQDIFGEIGTHAGLKCAAYVLVAAIRAEPDDTRGGKFGPYSQGSFDATQAGHAHIHEEYVRPEFAVQLDSLRAI